MSKRRGSSHTPITQSPASSSSSGFDNSTSGYSPETSSLSPATPNLSSPGGLIRSFGGLSVTLPRNQAQKNLLESPISANTRSRSHVSTPDSLSFEHHEEKAPSTPTHGGPNLLLPPPIKPGGAARVAAGHSFGRRLYVNSVTNASQSSVQPMEDDVKMTTPPSERPTLTRGSKRFIRQLTISSDDDEISSQVPVDTKRRRVGPPTPEAPRLEPMQYVPPSVPRNSDRIAAILQGGIKRGRSNDDGRKNNGGRE